jgi:hypothetical protein
MEAVHLQLFTLPGLAIWYSSIALLLISREVRSGAWSSHFAATIRIRQAANAIHAAAAPELMAPVYPPEPANEEAR